MDDAFSANGSASGSHAKNTHPQKRKRALLRKRSPGFPEEENNAATP
jgi:hypothetical protein